MIRVARKNRMPKANKGARGCTSEFEPRQGDYHLKVWMKALQAELTVGVSSAMLLLTHNLSSAGHY